MVAAFVLGDNIRAVMGAAHRVWPEASGAMDPFVCRARMLQLREGAVWAVGM